MFVTIKKKTLVKKIEVPKHIKTYGAFELWYAKEHKKLLEEGETKSKYRKKPVIVDAVRWTGDNFGELTDFMHNSYGVEDKTITIPTLEGIMKAQIGDWIIKGVQGEFFTCKPDIFRRTYERVEEGVAK